jgi:hypothetical protein
VSSYEAKKTISKQIKKTTNVAREVSEPPPNVSVFNQHNIQSSLVNNNLLQLTSNIAKKAKEQE